MFCYIVFLNWWLFKCAQLTDFLCYSDSSEQKQLFTKIGSLITQEIPKHDFLTTVALDVIYKCKITYKCTGTRFATDNAVDMASMRENIKNEANDGIIGWYECPAQLLNSWSKDLKVKEIKKNAVLIINYFRNNHLVKVKYTAAERKTLILPQEVHWPLNICSKMGQTFSLRRKQSF